MFLLFLLETEDYSQFPGETFTMGFLKNYGSYLKLDTGQLIHLYRGEKIEESQAPLEELTRPTTSYYTKINVDKNKILTIASVLIILISGYLIVDSFTDSSS
ncbi:helix-turn-helix domain-containing protein, partial [Leptospira ellisii]|uniref:helix-turn-helix domain-containing protein n=1 Tax=Leptospira ellisii TaxID=2023197 RepID=UPI000CCA1BE3